MLHSVAIDACSAGSGGAIRYLAGICPSMAEASPETTFYLLNRESQRAWLPRLPKNVECYSIPEATASRPFRLLWLQAVLPRILKRLRVDVLLATSEVSTLRPPCPYILVVHNFNPFSPMRGQIWSRGHLFRLAVQRELVRQCARRADSVVFVSEWSRQAMSPALGVSPEKSVVIYHGVDDTFRGASVDGGRPEETRRYLLVVSAVLEHKNLPRLVQAYADLARSLDGGLDLVIAGSVGSVKLRRSLERLLEDRGLLANVRFLDSVSSEALSTLYRQAELLAFPSLEETFGLPLIEAMASGLPVVTSNVSAMPEICADAAIYFDPYQVSDMTRAMERVLTDASLREELIRKGLERASTFSWQRAARHLLDDMSSLVQAN